MIAAADGHAPNPAEAQDLGEFVDALDRLRMSMGAPSYRTLAKLVGPRLRPPQVLAHTTVRDLFRPGRRRLDLDLVTATVRAMGLDERAVAEWRAACARVHGQARDRGPDGVFRQLPADLATFTGREKDLARLLDETGRHRAAGPATVVITAIEGMGGIGKTTLAVHAAHELVRSGRYADAQLYVDLCGFDPDRPPVDPSAVLHSFLRALAVPAHHIPDGVTERAAMFRDRLHGRHALVVLDNAADEEQIRPLIPASPTCLVLVTSRRSLAALEGASLHLLDTFSTAEAVDLLRAVAGAERIQADPQATERVIELCGHLPLAVALMAARLRSRPTWSAAELVERLTEGGIEALSGGRSLRRVFDLSYAGLSEPAKRLFALLGTHPGGDLSYEAAAALAGLEWPETRRLLEVLQDEYLVQQKSPGRYGLHDLVRSYAADVAAEHHDPAAAVFRLLMYYLDTADRADRRVSVVTQPLARELPPGCRPRDFADRDQALSWFDAEYANLLAGVRLAAVAGHHIVATELPLMMGGYFALRAGVDDWISTLQISLDSAIALGSPVRIGGSLNRLGSALTEGGRHREAVEVLSRAAELGRTLDDNGLLSKTARTNLAVAHERLGELDEAARLLAEVLPDQRRLGARVSEGVVLENLGAVHLKLTNYDLAVDYCEQAIEIYREQDRDSELINALNTMGQAYRKSGRLAAAEHSHREALARSRTLEAPRSEGHSLHQLGLTLRDRGDEAAAVTCLRDALEAYEEVGDPRAADVAGDLGPATDTGDRPLGGAAP